MPIQFSHTARRRLHVASTFARAHSARLLATIDAADDADVDEHHRER